MAQSYETRSPTLIPVKLVDFKPPQSWYDETADPFEVDERDIPNPELDAINAKLIANYDAMQAEAKENCIRLFGKPSL